MNMINKQANLTSQSTIKILEEDLEYENGSS